MKNKEAAKNILIVLLAAIAAVSIFRYISATAEKNSMVVSLTQAKEQATALQIQMEKAAQELADSQKKEAALEQESATLKENLQASLLKIDQMLADLNQARKNSDGLKSQVSLLKAENDAVMKDKARLSKENEELKLTLGSIAQLKRALDSLRGQAVIVGKDLRQRAKAGTIVEGNRGYLVRDGRITSPERVVIEVAPASPEQPGK